MKNIGISVAVAVCVIASGIGAIAFAPMSQPAKYKPIAETVPVIAQLPDGTLTWTLLGELAKSLGTSQYGALMDRGEIRVTSGTLVGVGNLEGVVFHEGEILPDGPVWNPSDAPVFVSMKRADERWTFEESIPSRGLMHIGLLAREPRIATDSDDSVRDGGVPPGCPSSASVTCVTGFWACCYIQSNGCPRAVCYKSTDPPPSSCTSGGEGSSSCSITIS
ncbi:MAG: hypothetical protein IT435_18950 [Phycisphaerales bacterium]|nr:hypothetical protein [Phycisphaerales bacterium]